MPKVITYKSKSGKNTRRMVVIDGQAYYESTGNNSDMPGVWLPFLMVVGSKSIEIPKEFHQVYNSDIEALLCNCPSGYIVKYESSTLKSPEISDSRLPTKKSIITSIQLGSPEGDYTKVLTHKEKQEAEKSKIKLENTGLVIEEPDEVNSWLIEQGAEFLKKSLTNKALADVAALLPVKQECSSMQKNHY